MKSTNYIETIQFQIGGTYYDFYLDDLEATVRLLEKRTVDIDDIEKVEYKGAHLYFSTGFVEFKHRGTRSTQEGAFTTEFDTTKDPIWLMSQFLQNTVYFCPAVGVALKVNLSTNEFALPPIKEKIHEGNFTLEFKTAEPTTDFTLSDFEELGYQIL